MMITFKKNKGFTLIEVMIVVAIVAILASIALPSYSNYIKKSRASNAGADLVSLGAALENIYQRTLTYPVAAAGTSADTFLQTNAGPLWKPSESANFSYTLEVTATTYKLTATGKSNSSGCNLTLNQANVRTISGGTACGGLSSW